MRIEKREKANARMKLEKGVVVCLTSALRAMYIYRNVLYCAPSSHSGNLDQQFKTNPFPPSSKGNLLSHSGGKYDGAMRKIKTAGPQPEISSVLFFSTRLSRSSNVVSVLSMADNTEIRARRSPHYARVTSSPL